MADTLRRFTLPLTTLVVLLAAMPSAAFAKSKPSYHNNPNEQTPLHLPGSGSKGGHSSTAHSTSATSGLEILRVIFALVIVIAFIFAVRWLLQKVNPKSLKGFKQTEAIELKASKALPNGSSLHVVQIGDRALLIGAGSGGVSMLSDLSSDDLAYLEMADTLGGKRKRSHSGGFAGVLSQTLTAPSRLEQARSSNSKGLINRVRDWTAR